MYRRDYFLNETQRLAQLISRLLGLKSEGKHQEVKQTYHNALTDEYELEPTQLEAFSLPDFEQWIRASAFSAAKLNTLAQLLYHNAEPFQPDSSTLFQLQKVLILLDVLEQQHHLQLFDNISKRQIIIKYIQQHHA
jgi:hypothetical protein